MERDQELECTLMAHVPYEIPWASHAMRTGRDSQHQLGVLAGIVNDTAIPLLIRALCFGPFSQNSIIVNALYRKITE